MHQGTPGSIDMSEAIVDEIELGGSIAKVRRFSAEDAGDVSALYERSVRTLGPRFYSAEQVLAWADLTPRPADFLKAYTDGRVALVAEIDNRLAAFGDVSLTGKMQYFYCAPEWSGKGVAGALFQCIERSACAVGVEELKVDASDLARPFFARRGFLWLGRQDLLLGNVPIHNHRMVKPV